MSWLRLIWQDEIQEKNYQWGRPVQHSQILFKGASGYPSKLVLFCARLKLANWKWLAQMSRQSLQSQKTSMSSFLKNINMCVPQSMGCKVPASQDSSYGTFCPTAWTIDQNLAVQAACAARSWPVLFCVHWSPEAGVQGFTLAACATKSFSWSFSLGPLAFHAVS